MVPEAPKRMASLNCKVTFASDWEAPVAAWCGTEARNIGAVLSGAVVKAQSPA